MSKTSIEYTLKNCKPNNLLTFQLNDHIINVVKYINSLDGGLFEMSVNNNEWDDGVGYLTIGEIMYIINNLKK